VLVLVLGYIQHWTWAFLLWPVDNLLRVLDFADVMQLYHIRLHSATGWWAASFALAFRLCVGFPLLKLLSTYVFFPLIGEKLLTFEELVDSLEDDHTIIRHRAARAIGVLGTSGQEAVTPLVVHLSDSSRQVRQQAEESLRQIDPSWLSSPLAQEAIPQLVERLSDEQRAIRQLAAEVLNRLAADWIKNERARRALPALIVRLIHESHHVRQAAEEVLTKLCPEWPASTEVQQVVPALADRLNHWNDGIRTAARNVLTRLDPPWTDAPQARSALWKLVKRLTDFRPWMYRSAADSLVWVGKPAVDVLIDGLSSWDLSRQKESAKVLGRIGPDAAKAVPALVDQLTSHTAAVRAAMVEALGMLGPAASHVIGPVVKLLRDDDGNVREAVKTALPRIDPKWRENRQVQNASWYIVHEFSEAIAVATTPDIILEAIRYIGEAAVQGLSSGLSTSTYTTTRLKAARLLGELGSKAHTALPALWSRARDPDPDVRQAVHSAIASIEMARPS
jgi:HEAT repeat protein